METLFADTIILWITIKFSFQWSLFEIAGSEM